MRGSCSTVGPKDQKLCVQKCNTINSVNNETDGVRVTRVGARKGVGPNPVKRVGARRVGARRVGPEGWGARPPGTFTRQPKGENKHI